MTTSVQAMGEAQAFTVAHEVVFYNGEIQIVDKGFYEDFTFAACSDQPTDLSSLPESLASYA